MIMARKIRQTIFVCAAGLFLAGCVSDQELAGYSAKEAGFSVVAASVSRGTGGKDTVWIQNTDQARAVSARVHALVHKKTINADTAVGERPCNLQHASGAGCDIQ